MNQYLSGSSHHECFVVKEAVASDTNSPLQSQSHKILPLALICARRASNFDCMYFTLKMNNLWEYLFIQDKYLTLSEDFYSRRASYCILLGSSSPVSSIVALLSQFCKPVVVWRDGIVWHSGCVECIVARTSEKGRTNILLCLNSWRSCLAEIVLQTSSYLPNVSEGEQVALKENVHSVFNMFADLVEFVLIDQQQVWSVNCDFQISYSESKV